MIMALEIIQVYLVLFFSVILHECAHGWVAFKFGDPTAKLAGRLTLNPLKHIDPIGTFVVPFVLKWLGFFPLGWAKPVPVNYANLRNPRRDMIWVSLAGPATNLILATVFRYLLMVTHEPMLHELFLTGVFINLMLAVFNLIPMPPLDGSRVVLGLLPIPWAREYARLERWGIVVMIILLNLGMLEWMWKVVMLLAGFWGLDARF